ncbi:MAG: hypothetical protein K2X38_15180 [Gemmataceae bacterium]|nr:hypothetical protein [Gemmataceae bacterium]
MNPHEDWDDAQALRKCKLALQLVCAQMPHLAGLSQVLRLQPHAGVATFGVFASGRLVFNPEFLRQLTMPQTVFVLAHELMHLALETHARGSGSDPVLVNVAHDIIINDMLISELGEPGIEGILRFPGARDHSLEKILAYFRKKPKAVTRPGWPAGPSVETAMGRALRDAGVIQKSQSVEADVLGQDLEEQWFPGESSRERREQADAIREIAGQARSLSVFFDQMQPSRGDPYDQSKKRRIAGQPGEYQVPWEQALQSWLDAVTPAARTFGRVSRRGGDRTDVVLPGRNRDHWTLHVVLDTSGSMLHRLPAFLTALAAGCRSVGVDRIRIVHCDKAVRKVHVVDVEQLEDLTAEGFSGSEGWHILEDVIGPAPAPEEPPREEEPPRQEELPPEAIAPVVAPEVRPPVPAYTYAPIVSPPSATRYVYRPYYSPTRPSPPPISRTGSLPGLGRSPGDKSGGKGRKGSRKAKYPFLGSKRKSGPKPKTPKAEPSGWTEFTANERQPFMEWVPEDSNVTPALAFFAADSTVESVVVLTDGLTAYPALPPPFSTLWVLPSAEHAQSFSPPFGQVVTLSGE